VAKVREHGGLCLAAEQAGVDVRTVQRLRASDPAFDERVTTARELYADTLEHEMVDQARQRGNPVGYIVRLKALRPEDYIERHKIMSLNVNVDATPDDAPGLLRAMLGDVTPATLQSLSAPSGAPRSLPEGSGMGTGEIIDADPPHVTTEPVHVSPAQAQPADTARQGAR